MPGDLLKNSACWLAELLFIVGWYIDIFSLHPLDSDKAHLVLCNVFVLLPHFIVFKHFGIDDQFSR